MKHRKLFVVGESLKDLDGNLIAQKGDSLTRGLILEVQKRGKKRQNEFISLNNLKFLSDARKVMHEALYTELFEPAAIQRALISILQKTKMPRSAFREIERLRQASPYTYKHFLITGLLCARMAYDMRKLGYNPSKAFICGLCHDIGKIRIPGKTLNKKTALNSNEYRRLRAYPVISLLLLKYYFPKKAVEVCRAAYDHHEKLDGSGYPRGIRNLEKYTKLTAVADIYDALVSDRPYRKRAFTSRGAIDRLLREKRAGKLPAFPVLLLISYLRRDKPNYRRIKVSLSAREAEPLGNVYGKIAR